MADPRLVKEEINAYFSDPDERDVARGFAEAVDVNGECMPIEDIKELVAGLHVVGRLAASADDFRWFYRRALLGKKPTTEEIIKRVYRNV